jgi:hypothetical protein
MRALHVVVVALGVAFLFAGAANADDKKKKDDKGATNFDDLFGSAPQKPSSLDAMKKASDGVGAKTGSNNGLAAKTGTVDDNAAVTLMNVFAAEHILHDDKKGCQSKDKIKIAEWTFDDTPARGKPFEVCLTVASQIGREVRIDTAVVDSRNGRIATGSGDMLNFSGHTKVDSILAFPAPMFNMPGQYFYVVDVDGKEAGRLPLFVVKTGGGEAAPVKASTGDASHKGGAAKDAPLTAKEPDAPQSPTK